MPIAPTSHVTVKRCCQVSIPASLRAILPVNEGDILEVVVQDGAFVMTPKRPADQENPRRSQAKSARGRSEGGAAPSADFLEAAEIEGVSFNGAQTAEALLAAGLEHVITFIGPQALPFITDEELAEIAKIDFRKPNFRGLTRAYNLTRTTIFQRRFA